MKRSQLTTAIFGLTATLMSAAASPSGHAVMKKESRSPERQITVEHAAPAPGMRKAANDLTWKRQETRSSLSMPDINRPPRRAAAPMKSPASYSSDMPVLQGCVGFSDTWIDAPLVGVYELTSTALNPVHLDDAMLTSYGQVYADGKYFVAVPEIWYGFVVMMEYHIYDTNDGWKKTTVEGDPSFQARAMAHDPLSHRVYAITENADEYTFQLAELDMNTYKHTTIKDYGYGRDYSALMCSPKGVLYGIDKEGVLVKFDKLTGEYTEVGSLGIKSGKMTSATIDPETGRCFYICYSDGSSEMFEVDLETAEAKYLYRMPGAAQVLSLYTPDAPVAENAPAKPHDLRLTFEGAAFSGEASFIMPNQTEGGADLTGNATYTMEINGDVLASGTAAPGEVVTHPMEITVSGEYTLSVTVENEAGKGATAAVTQWLGHNRPANVTGVKLSEADGQLTLTWDPVETGTMNGFFDPSNVTYTVVSYPDNKEVASGLTETTFTCPAPTPEAMTRYNFGVTAVNGDTRSFETVSNNLLSGNIIPPFTEDFGNADAMDLFTIHDSNNDGKTWSYYLFGDTRSLLINYNYSLDMDDWVVLWPVTLEAEKSYTIGCDVRGTLSYYTERLEIKIARSGDVESLKAGETVLAPTDITGEDLRPMEGTFVPSETGTYYIGYHGCSPSGQNKLYMDNIRVSTGVATHAPDMVTDIEITPDGTGKLLAEITFKAPLKDISGNDLTDISAVRIERDGQTVGSVTATTPGEVLRYTDNAPANGTNTYTFTPLNSYGEGKQASASAYIGLVAPNSPSEVAFMHGANPGQAVITWDPAETDLEGHPLNNTNVTYNVLRTISSGTPKTVVEGLTECTYTDQALNADESQAFVHYAIVAVTAGGESEPAMSNIYPLGKPYATPSHESFKSLQDPDLLWGAEAPQESFTSWDIYDEAELPIKSYDGNAMAVAYAMYASDINTASLISGLFDLSTLDTPTLSFFLYDMGASKNAIDVYVNDGNDWSLAGSATFGQKNQEWVKQTIDLSAYKGKTVCIEFLATVRDINVIAIDNMRIANDVDHNLSALSIAAPEKANANEKITVAVGYENSGKFTAEDYTLELYLDGRKIAEAQGEPIAPSTFMRHEFETSLPVVSSEAPVFQCKVNYAADEDATDNATAEATVKFTAPTLPAPEALTAEATEEAVQLTWESPDMSKLIITPSVDDLESYTPFSTGLPTTPIEDDYMGEWSVYDVDGLPTYSGTLTYPGIGNPAAFVIYNSYIAGEDYVFATHSGHQMFLCMASKPDNGKVNDDWLVSPLLAGCAQTISFYSRSVSANEYGPDTFEVLYSTTGKEIADFTMISRQETTGDWAEYEFDLPEGALYFAIRCISNDKFAMLVDDITLVTEHDVIRDLEISGYNVYCNGSLVNETPLTDMSFTHNTGLTHGETYTYHVSAIYNYGESAPSAPAEVNYTGLDGVDGIDTDSTVSVTTAPGTIIVTGASGMAVTVSNTAGQTVASATPTAELRVSVAPGIYVVKAGQTVAKVVVR